MRPESEYRRRLHEGSELGRSLLALRTQNETARLMRMKVPTLARVEYLALWKISKRLREVVNKPL